MKGITRHLGRLAGCTRGAAAVEFAIISMALIMLLVGILDLGRTFYIYNEISYLSDRAVRSIMLNPDLDDATLETRLREGFMAGNRDSLVVSLTSEVSASGTNFRVVTVGFPVALLVPNIGDGLISLQVSRRAPVN